MDREEIRREGMQLIESLKVAYLSTIGLDGTPQVRAVFNLRGMSHFPGLAPLYAGHETDFMVYFTTNTSSVKVREIQANPGVSAYFCRPEEFFGLMLTGRCEPVEERTIKDAVWQEGWELYYPKGKTDPDYTVLRLCPERMKGWHRGEPFLLRLPF